MSEATNCCLKRYLTTTELFVHVHKKNMWHVRERRGEILISDADVFVD